jgi:translation initiation factor 4E
MLAAIGETFETPYGENPSPDMPFTDEVTGVIVSSRKAFYRISIWTRSADSLAKVGDIGKHFKHGVLGVSGKIVGGYTSDVEFQSHRDSQVGLMKPRVRGTSDSAFFSLASSLRCTIIQVRGKKPAFVV